VIEDQTAVGSEAGRFVDANAITLFTLQTGAISDPAVLIISGTGNDLRAEIVETTNHPLNALGLHTIRYDQRGLGQSSIPDVPYSMADYADDAAALITRLTLQQHPKLTGPIDVVGISFGGMVAQHLAIRHPHLVRRLVLCCTSSGGAGGDSFDLLGIADLPEDERVRITVEVMDTRNDLTTIPPTWAPGYLQLAKRAAVSRRLMLENPLGPMGARRQLEARAHHDVWNDLQQLAHPTLVCGGRFDAQAPPANVEQLARQIPNARLAMFDGGHPFLWQDQRAWPAIAAFLQAEFLQAEFLQAE
jgi:3-oxoadipate enol-lactonase